MSRAVVKHSNSKSQPHLAIVTKVDAPTARKVSQVHLRREGDDGTGSGLGLGLGPGTGLGLGVATAAWGARATTAPVGDACRAKRSAALPAVSG